jgi:hypothetical protein
MIKDSTRIALHAYLQKCPAEERLALYQYLVPNERQALEKLPKTYGNPLADHATPASTLRRIHHSWIAPFLRMLSEKEIGLFLASLDQPHAIAVGKELLFTGKYPSTTHLGKEFLQQTLLGYLTAEVEDLLPIVFLPESPLNVLLDLKDETVSLSLDFLGLHDLSIEVRQIIEKQKLNAIYAALAPAQLNYLKILSQSQEPVAFTRMGLANWDEDKEKLKLLVQQRGANRLAKALYGQNPSLVWYVMHKLDVERALTVQKLYSPLENNRAVQILIHQVIEFTNYIRKHHE